MYVAENERMLYAIAREVYAPKSPTHSIVRPDYVFRSSRFAQQCRDGDDKNAVPVPISTCLSVRVCVSRHAL